MTYENSIILFKEFLEGWLAIKKTSLHRRTWGHYKQVTHSYVIPRIGKLKIKDLRTDHIQRLYNNLLAKDVGVYTVRKIHTVLHSALAHATRTGVIGRNPASNAIQPKKPPKEMKICDESQISQLLVAVRGNRYEALVYLAVTTGMRQMELLGLKWTDLNWIKQTLKIERQLVRPYGDSIRFSSPKTRSGRRNLSLGDKTILMLREHYQRQHEERQAAGVRWQEHGLIFPNNIGGPMDPRNLLRDFRKILKAAGLPILRFHNLRHTEASLMLNTGIPVIIVSRRLGHSRPSVTLDVYGHLIPSMQAEAAEKIEELITPIPLHQTNQKPHPIAPNCTETAPEL
jgi:integrase